MTLEMEMEMEMEEETIVDYCMESREKEKMKNNEGSCMYHKKTQKGLNI